MVLAALLAVAASQDSDRKTGKRGVLGLGLGLGYPGLGYPGYPGYPGLFPGYGDHLGPLGPLGPLPAHLSPAHLGPALLPGPLLGPAPKVHVMSSKKLALILPTQETATTLFYITAQHRKSEFYRTLF